MSNRNYKPLVCFLAVLFGISSWVEVNGLWVELPLLVNRLPEKGYMASYLILMTQIANLGPIIYSIVRKYCRNNFSDQFLINVTMMIGTTACVLMIFFWSNTTQIGDSSKERSSVSFLVLAFFLAFVDCTSSVLYMPFMSRFKEVYLLPYMIGEGLSGLIPGVVALIQGIGGNPECVPIDNNGTSTVNGLLNVEVVYPQPRFSIEIFFVFLTGMLLISWMAFILLNVLPAAQTEQVIHTNVGDSGFGEGVTSCCGRSQYNLNANSVDSNIGIITEADRIAPPKEGQLSSKHYKILLILQGSICCFTNTGLPSVQTLSCQPYGTVAYHLSATLSSIANPLACFIAIAYWSRNFKFISGLTLVGGLSGAYILTTAFLSPTPPLVGSKYGEALVIISWIVFQGVLSYVKACIASSLRQYGGGQKPLFYYGVSTQVGSFVGAVVMFCLINYSNIFKFYVPCVDS